MQSFKLMSLPCERPGSNAPGRSFFIQHLMFVLWALALLAAAWLAA